MVEFYDLKLAGVRSNGETTPSNTKKMNQCTFIGMDEHIANLDFETSSIVNEESMFESMAGMGKANL